MILFLLGSFVVTGGSTVAKQDSWACVALAALVAVPVVLIYAGLCKAAPGQDIFDMAYSAFGKIVGPIITALFSVYTIHLGALVIRDFSEFLQVVSLPETPQVAVAICIGLIVLYNVVKGIEVPARGAVFIMPITLLVLLLIYALSFKYCDFRNLMPIFNQDIQTMVTGTYDGLVFPFGELVMFITVFAVVEKKSEPAKLYIAAVLFSGIVLTVLVMITTMIIGYPLVASLYFPAYSAIGIIDVGNFISRIEALLSGVYIIFGMMKVAVCLYVGCKGISKLFGIKNHKKVATPITAVMIIMSVLVYKNTMQLFTFLKIYAIYAPFFQILIPVALLIGLRKKIKKERFSEMQKALGIEPQATLLSKDNVS